MQHVKQKINTTGLHPWVAFRDGLMIGLLMFFMVIGSLGAALRAFDRAADLLLPPGTNPWVALLFNVTVTTAVSCFCALTTMRVHDWAMKTLHQRRQRQFQDGTL